MQRADQIAADYAAAKAAGNFDVAVSLPVSPQA
jgi:hypothetical protein